MSSVRSIFSLLTIALSWTMSASAPLPESSGDPELLQFVQKNREFVLRIKQDVSRVRKLMQKEFKIHSDDELMLMREMLDISQMDLSLCRTDPCDLAGCFNQIRTGLQTYHGYFSRIKELLPNFAGHVDGLQVDVSNLSSNLQQQMQENGLTVVAYPQTESQANPSFLESEKEAGSYLVLRNFERFLEMTFRALRHCSS
ncbi:PREDICTED: myelomonocytic growth factor-like [Gekko japonicus]|uniref:Myelomonocytic growth factor-like n=1 Tax=Gekko japonicus TaxID=146911 RepID=A0ABM1KZ72_GEKJA|nr:PREDICTED: myelomonocytic growth factor-like [Gekko japonicus]